MLNIDRPLTTGRIFVATKIWQSDLQFRNAAFNRTTGAAKTELRHYKKPIFVLSVVILTCACIIFFCLRHLSRVHIPERRVVTIMPVNVYISLYFTVN